MAIQNNPNDPYDHDRLRDPIRSDIDGRSPAQLDADLQADPELAVGSAGSAKIAMFALAVAVVLGLVFYGLNSSSVNQQNAGTTPAPATAQNSSPPAAPPGMRDVTPRTNTEPGTTTGSAPTQNPPTAPANNAGAPANR